MSGNNCTLCDSQEDYFPLLCCQKQACLDCLEEFTRARESVTDCLLELIKIKRRVLKKTSFVVGVEGSASDRQVGSNYNSVCNFNDENFCSFDPFAPPGCRTNCEREGMGDNRPFTRYRLCAVYGGESYQGLEGPAREVVAESRSIFSPSAVMPSANMPHLNFHGGLFSVKPR